MAQCRPRGTPETVFPWKVTEEIKGNIIRGRNKYIFQMVEPWDKSNEWILEQLFPEEILTWCKRGFESSTDYVGRYNQCDYPITSDVKFNLGHVTLCKLGMLPPSNKFQREEFIPELVNYCNHIRAILYDYAKVSHVFNWLNESRISEAAIVNYCPWVKSLLPTFHKIKGSRYREPQFLATKLDLIKEVAGIMTKALLVQGETNTPKQGVMLTFQKSTVNGIEIPEYKHEC